MALTLVKEDGTGKADANAGAIMSEYAASLQWDLTNGYTTAIPDPKLIRPELLERGLPPSVIWQLHHDKLVAKAYGISPGVAASKPGWTVFFETTHGGDNLRGVAGLDGLAHGSSIGPRILDVSLHISCFLLALSRRAFQHPAGQADLGRGRLEARSIPVAGNPRPPRHGSDDLRWRRGAGARDPRAGHRAGAHRRRVLVRVMDVE